MRREITRVGAVAVLLVAAAAGSLSAATAHLEGYVPAAAHTPGSFDSFWTTDLWISQQGATTIHLWFNLADADNSAVDSVVLPLTEPVTHLRDVVGSFFGRDDAVGSIHYLADGLVAVTSRTWTTAPEGGSYGQTIPGVPLSEAAAAGAVRMVVDQEAGFRTNLGLVNVSAVEAEVMVEIFTADGGAAPGDSSFAVTLPPFAMTQVNDLLARLDPGERPGLIVRAGVTSAGGAILAYLSTVDNQTNDASYQEGVRFSD
jgi:hypothetical protein